METPEFKAKVNEIKFALETKRGLVAYSKKIGRIIEHYQKVDQEVFNALCDTDAKIAKLNNELEKLVVENS